ncbi:MAG: SPFH domain-containing protein [Planctomycetota bacterium]
MRNYTTLFIAIVIFLVLAIYMTFYQVRFDEYAVVTTWEKADVPTYDDAGELVDAGSLVTDPGIYFKGWPWPIKKVYRYPTTVQLLEQELIQFQTRDQNAVVLQTYVTWRIDDPYAFFVQLRNLERAREVLGTQMSNLVGEFSKYRFDQMVNIDPDRLALDDIEREATAQLRDTIDTLNYGIQIEQVGVRRLLLDESTTTEVFNRMRSTRERLAASAEQEGESQATEIRSEAERVKGQILSFAEAEATRIRAEGVRDATASYDVFEENPELAIFLSKVDTMRKMLPGSTLILDANALEFFDLITSPDAEAPTDTANTGGE